MIYNSELLEAPKLNLSLRNRLYTSRKKVIHSQQKAGPTNQSYGPTHIASFNTKVQTTKINFRWQNKKTY